MRRLSTFTHTICGHKLVPHHKTRDVPTSGVVAELDLQIADSKRVVLQIADSTALGGGLVQIAKKFKIHVFAMETLKRGIKHAKQAFLRRFTAFRIKFHAKQAFLAPPRANHIKLGGKISLAEPILAIFGVFLLEIDLQIADSWRLELQIADSWRAKFQIADSKKCPPSTPLLPQCGYFRGVARSGCLGFNFGTSWHMAHDDGTSK